MKDVAAKVVVAYAGKKKRSLCFTDKELEEFSNRHRYFRIELICNMWANADREKQKIPKNKIKKVRALFTVPRTALVRCSQESDDRLTDSPQRLLGS
jgi:hypothetical protein